MKKFLVLILSITMECSLFIGNQMVYAEEVQYENAVEETDKNVIVVETVDTETINEYELDNILRDYGTPGDVLCQYTKEQKKEIIEGIKDYQPEYEDFNSEYAESQLTKARTVTTLNGMQSNLKFNVLAYRIKINSQEYVCLNISFKWGVNDDVKNDYFGFALSDGWELLPDRDYPFKLFLYDGTTSSYISPAVYNASSHISMYGAGNIITDGGSASVGDHYEGLKLVYAKKKNSNASNAMAITYVHDYSSCITVTYGVNIKVASIAVTSNSKDSVSYGKIVSFSYK